MLCDGDLNDVVMDREKIGGILRSSQKLYVGRQSLDICGLLDLGFEGYPFT